LSFSSRYLCYTPKVFRGYVKEWRHAVAHLVAALRYKPEGRGLIPDGVIEMPYLQFFRLHSGFGGSTQPLTEMNARVIFWGVKVAGA
jgi:hypothetical protein